MLRLQAELVIVIVASTATINSFAGLKGTIRTFFSDPAEPAPGVGRHFGHEQQSTSSFSKSCLM